MRKITAKDLEDCFLCVVRDSEHRQHLPFIRRHFRSVRSVCQNFIERHIDIYFSGVFVASKDAGKSRIVMDEEYTKDYQGQFYEVKS